jgi:hypothetical protein
MTIFSINITGSFFRAPMTPLLDSFVISSIPDKRDYGNFRLWGAASFGICSLLGGFLTSHLAGNGKNVVVTYSPIFIIATVSSMCTALIIVKLKYDSMSSINAAMKDVSESTEVELASLKSDELMSLNDTDLESCEDPEDQKLPTTADESTNKPAEIKVEQSQKQLSFKDLLSLLLSSEKGIPVFSAIVLLSGFGGGAIDAFLFLRLKQLGGSSLCMGVARIITCASEIPMFQVAGTLHARYGTWKMLALTQLAFVVRFLYYSELSVAWWVLPCEVLHGLTFATTWSVSCTFANEVSPQGADATMQAILEGLHFGLGSGLGALLGGLVYDTYGAVVLFRLCASLSFISFLLASLKTLMGSCQRSPVLSLRKAATLLPTQDIDSA